MADADTEDYSVLGHVVSDDTAPVEAINLGGIEVRDYRVKYPDKKSHGDDPVTLGLDVLSGYRVLLDFPAQKMYVAPPATVATGVHIGPTTQSPQTGTTHR